MTRIIALLLLVAFLAQHATAGLCTVAFLYKENWVTPWPSKGTGAVPFGFTLSSSWTVWGDNGVDQHNLDNQTTTVAGTGWFSGLGYFCTAANGMTAPNFAPAVHYNSGIDRYDFQVTIWQELQGGFPATAPWGCAGSQSILKPDTPLTVRYHSSCNNGTPIIVDTCGEGFHLTSLENGVQFREGSKDGPIQMSWLDPNYRNAWLALPDERGEVTSLERLFGNFTPQPPSEHPNGFLALAQYDANRDGVINSLDPVYPKLRLWIDSNHDGIAQAGELHTLQELKVKSISLDYHESKLTDQYGNQFRYVAPADIDNVGRQDDRVYDVFLVTEPSTP